MAKTRTHPPSAALIADLAQSAAAVARDPSDFNAIIAFGEKTMRDITADADEFLQLRDDTLLERMTALGAVLSTLDGILASTADATFQDLSAHEPLQENMDALKKLLDALKADKAVAQRLTDSVPQLKDDCIYCLDAMEAAVAAYDATYIPAAKGTEKAQDVVRQKDNLRDRAVILESARAGLALSKSGKLELLQAVNDILEKAEEAFNVVSEKIDVTTLYYKQTVKSFYEGSPAPVQVKKPLQFRPKF